jgi:citrate lyase subunit beta / citryl-CoA lyase
MNNRTKRRPPHLRRTWLFVGGADEEAQLTALASGADVIIADLEDFTPPELRSRARDLIPKLMDECRSRGIVAAVRINPLDGDGQADLAAVMRGRPDCVLLPKTESAQDITDLERALSGFEGKLPVVRGATEIVPNVETAHGLMNTYHIALASERVKACLVAAEDMAASLGAERSRDALELAYARQRFLVECSAAGVIAIDCPYTFSDADGAGADTLYARRLGYKAKCLVAPAHVAAINGALTPSDAQVAKARQIVSAFDAARGAGQDRVDVDGSLVEVPTYMNAKRLISRHEELKAYERG